MNYEAISENTLDHIYLHDCVINHVTITGNRLILEFGHIDVLPEHPLNQFPQAKYTSTASLIFEDFEVIEAIQYYITNVQNNQITAGQDTIKISLDIQELGQGFEVLHFEKKVDTGNYFVYEFSGVTSIKGRNDFGMFLLKFKNVKVCWNELIDNSWFVN